MNRRITITNRVLQRCAAALGIAALAGTVFGYWLAPGRPWQFAHLTAGSYLAAFSTRGECDAARAGFGAGRGIPTAEPMTVGRDFIDMCSHEDAPIGAPIVRLDMDAQ